MSNNSLEQNGAVPKSNKVGSVKKCPNCGASVNNTDMFCSQCGYEFNSRESNSTALALLQKLEEIDRQYPIQSGTSKFASAFTGRVSDNVSHKCTLIQNFPIPNTKEDLLEFATLCASNMGRNLSNNDVDGNALTAAWRNKANQVKFKIEILLKDDPEGQAAVKSITAVKRKLSPAAIAAIGLGVFLIIDIIIIIIVCHSDGTL